LDLNRYGYGRFNPIRFKDPSGFCGADTGNNAENTTLLCEELEASLEEIYGLEITGEWTLEEMILLADGIEMIIETFTEVGVEDAEKEFIELYSGLTLNRTRQFADDANAETFEFGDYTEINFYNGTFSQLLASGGYVSFNQLTFRTIAHEFGHVWDESYNRGPSELFATLSGAQLEPIKAYGDPLMYIYDHPQPPSLDVGQNPNEDWAIAFSWFVVDQNQAEVRVTAIEPIISAYFIK
jgi:hypothetical protein